MTVSTVEAINRRFKKAVAARSLWETLWDDVYTYTMPARARFFSNTPGEERSEEIYDSTAVVALQEFANRMQDAITPNFAAWFELVPGTEIPEAQRAEVAGQLADVTRYAVETIQQSNYALQVHEIYQDIGIGTGALAVEADDDKLIRFHAAPMPSVYMDKAANGHVDGVFRLHKLDVQEIMQKWPDVTLPQHIVDRARNENDDNKVEVVEANYRDWDEPLREIYHWQLFLPQHKTQLETNESEGQGAKAWITPRWSVAAGEIYGRGPLIQVMPDIRTINLLVQMILENAELAIAGMWQADDNGVVAPDQIQIIPGSIIPRRPNSRGLEALGPATQFDVGQLTIERLQDNIRQSLFNQRLGNLERTPRSATEIIERQSDLAKLIGSAFGRLNQELADPVVTRVVRLLKDQGRIELPRINGREIAIKSKSPLARAQRLDEVQNLSQFVGLSQQLFGQQAMLKINAEESMKKMAEWLEVPPELLNSEAQQQELIEQLQQLGGQAAEDGVPTT